MNRNQLRKVLDTICPECKAVAGTPCRSINTRQVLQVFHVQRWDKSR